MGEQPPFPTISEAEWLLPRAKEVAKRLGTSHDETPLGAGFWDLDHKLTEAEREHARELAAELEKREGASAGGQQMPKDEAP